MNLQTNNGYNIDVSREADTVQDYIKRRVFDRHAKCIFKANYI